jgi:hypothetical protein
MDFRMSMTRFLRSFAALAACALAAPPAFTQSVGPARAPVAAKASRVEAFRLAPVEPVQIRLEAPDPAAIESLRAANAQSVAKRLEIGIGREVDAALEAPRWQALRDGRVAHWQVTSAGARALRLALATSGLVRGAEVRFAGSDQPGLVYGPFDGETLRAAGNWSPVLEGETATMEVFVPGAQGEPGMAVEQVSHLFVSPSDPKATIAAKAALPCAVNFICRAATDPALAETGSAVARMTFTSASGGTALCSGTLLNPADGSFQPYFHSAAHCFAPSPRRARSPRTGSTRPRPAPEPRSGRATCRSPAARACSTPTRNRTCSSCG